MGFQVEIRNSEDDERATLWHALAYDPPSGFGVAAIFAERAPADLFIAESKAGRMLGIPGNCEMRIVEVDEPGLRLIKRNTPSI